MSNHKKKHFSSVAAKWYKEHHESTFISTVKRTPINSQGAVQFSDNRAKNEVINDLSNEC